MARPAPKMSHSTQCTRDVDGGRRSQCASATLRVTPSVAYHDAARAPRSVYKAGQTCPTVRVVTGMPRRGALALLGVFLSQSHLVNS